MEIPDEWLDVVDPNDNVIGKASRKEVHEKSLLHRAVHIMVFNGEGKLFLQKRSPAKDENPGLWDTSAAGHVGAGESYLTTAHRELEEELGIKAELEFFLKLTASRDTANEHLEIFICAAKHKILINKSEISEGQYWSLDEIRKAINRFPGNFTSSFKLIFENYLRKKE